LNSRVRILPRLILTALGLVLDTLVFAPPLILLSLFTSGGPAYRIMRWWAFVLSKLMGLSFSIHGAEKIVPGASYIVTPNHQSNADILALVLVLPVRFRWVIKRSLLRIPLFGWALGGTGAIAIDRSNRQQSVESLRRASEQLKGGWSVLIYPEGTRTSDGQLLPFKKGAFMMAVQTGIPILPVTNNGAFKVLPRNSVWFRPGHITVTIGDPIVTEGLSEKDVPALMDRTRAEISKALDPNYDPFGKRAG
jgi:1-acyl-sn-glycerol-3-phosphate acyltransferase